MVWLSVGKSERRKKSKHQGLVSGVVLSVSHSGNIQGA